MDPLQDARSHVSYPVRPASCPDRRQCTALPHGSSVCDIASEAWQSFFGCAIVRQKCQGVDASIDSGRMRQKIIGGSPIEFEEQVCKTN